MLPHERQWMPGISHFLQDYTLFEVFKETPTGQLTEANRHAKLSCSLNNCWMKLTAFDSVKKRYHVYD